MLHQSGGFLFVTITANLLTMSNSGNKICYYNWVTFIICGVQNVSPASAILLLVLWSLFVKVLPIVNRDSYERPPLMVFNFLFRTI